MWLKTTGQQQKKHADLVKYSECHQIDLTTYSKVFKNAHVLQKRTTLLVGQYRNTKILTQTLLVQNNLFTLVHVAC